MAAYKVPQDVEADDKLLGPFSFRQFIYLIIVALSITMAYFLAKLFIGLILIPMPLIIVFGALALPLRKDQPMETYLLAMVRFFLKPRLRFWQPEGLVTMVTITAPRIIERQLTKGFSGNEAHSRLSYLARLMDTRGWAAKGLSAPMQSVASMGSIAVSDSDLSNDMMDDDDPIAQSFDNLLNRKEVEQRQAALLHMQEASRITAISPVGTQPTPPVAVSDEGILPPRFNPYPTMRQHVLNPIATQPLVATPPPAEPNSATPIIPVPPAGNQNQTMTPALPPDIINLALTESNNLSISTIASEAHRLEKKLDDGDEVVVSLR